MKTDSFINRFFGEFLGAFFTLIGEDEHKAERYEFTSIEVKELSFRFDAVVQPTAPEDKLYFFEAQFKPEEDFYLRFFGETAVYLRQKKPKNVWRAVVLFPNEAADPGVHPHYEEFFESGRLRRVYLTGVPPELLEKFPLNLLRIIIEPEDKVIATVEEIIRQLPEQISDERTQEVFVDLLMNLLLSKLPKMSRQEIEKMFEPFLSDVKKSRFYQEVAEEVAQELTFKITQELTPRITQELTPRITQELTPRITQELTPRIAQELTPRIAQELTPQITQELTPQIMRESKYGIAKTMLKKNFDLELIAEITGLSPEEIRTLSRQMTDGTN